MTASLTWSVTGLVALALGVQAGQGYLPRVGPPPLRFETPPPIQREPVVLPPLVAAEPPGQLAPAPSPSPAPESETTAESLPGNTPPAPDLFQPFMVPLIPFSSAMTPADAGAAVSVISPQAFIKYFTGQPGTNAIGVSIFAPVGFVPPVPTPLPSSSATFQTVPAGKP